MQCYSQHNKTAVMFCPNTIVLPLAACMLDRNLFYGQNNTPAEACFVWFWTIYSSFMPAFAFTHMHTCTCSPDDIRNYGKLNCWTPNEMCCFFQNTFLRKKGANNSKCGNVFIWHENQVCFLFSHLLWNTPSVVVCVCVCLCSSTMPEALFAHSAVNITWSMHLSVYNRPGPAVGCIWQRENIPVDTDGSACWN